MKSTRIVKVLIAILIVTLAVGWIGFSGKFDFLTVDWRAKIEIDGKPVEGDFVSNKTTGIVTTRIPGKKHSYQLFFEGDQDFTGDIGSVLDCEDWVAPRSSFILESRTYSHCKGFGTYRSLLDRQRLVRKGNSFQFVANDGATIGVVFAK